MNDATDTTAKPVPASDSSHWFKVACHYEIALRHIGRIANIVSVTLEGALVREPSSAGPWEFREADADECMALVRAIEDVSARAQVEFG